MAQRFYARVKEWRARDGFHCPSVGALAVTAGFPREALRNTFKDNRIDQVQDWTEGSRCGAVLEDMYDECGGTQGLMVKLREANGVCQDAPGPTKRARADDAAGSSADAAVSAKSPVDTGPQPQSPGKNLVPAAQGLPALQLAQQPPQQQQQQPAVTELLARLKARDDEITALKAKVHTLEVCKSKLEASVETLVIERDAATKAAAAAAGSTEAKRATASSNTGHIATFTPTTNFTPIGPTGPTMCPL
eukprot:g5526.t1